MKTIRLFTVFTLSLLSLAYNNEANAQEVYLKGSLGYGLKSGAQNLDLFFNSTKGTVTTKEQVFVSFGKGFNGEATFGYMFNNHLGAEFGVSYLLGSKFTTIQKDEDGYLERTISSNMISLNPSVIVSGDPDNTIIPFAKFGFIIGKGSLIETLNYFDAGSEDNLVFKWKRNGGIALGIKAGVGASYVLSDNLSIFGEVNMTGMSYGPKQGEMIEATLNSEDILGDLETIEKEVNYVTDFTVNEDPSDDEPAVMLKEKLPYGSFGLNIGVRYSFSY